MYAEAGGVAGLYSLNYEAVLYSKQRAFNFTIGFGASYSPYDKTIRQEYILFFPFHLSGLIHYNKSSSIELGLDPVFTMDHYYHTSRALPGSYVNDFGIGGLVPHLGYRYQKEDGGFFMKIYFSPLTAWLRNGRIIYNTPFKNSPWIDGQVVLWGGIGLGYTFKEKG